MCKNTIWNRATDGLFNRKKIVQYERGICFTCPLALFLWAALFLFQNSSKTRALSAAPAAWALHKSKKKRFFNSLFQCNTFLSKFSLTRPQATIAKDPGTDGEVNLQIYINNTCSETKNCQRTIFLGFVHTCSPSTQDWGDGLTDWGDWCMAN